ncbi:MAG: hypothetical protein ABIP99_08965 [Ilumatobacteraceae bacterium]
MRSPKGRLELTWMGKDITLISSEDSKYDYECVDPRAWEVKCTDLVRTIGEATSATGANKNLPIVGDSGDALHPRTERSVRSSR